ncbi:hypothetical protein EPO15_08315 [bacterium]|nr:MAG: hypothetical protein EPO15_08315 [bacterium]
MAANITAADAQRLAKSALAEVTVLREALRDRGAKFFGRPLGMAAAIAFAAYYYIYLPPLTNAKKVSDELATAKATSQYAEEYQNLQSRLSGLYTKLPRTQDPQGWILNEVRKTLREESIVPLSISPPNDLVKGEYRFITIEVRCQGNYPQIASWISRLERNPALLFVRDLTLRKDADPIGSNTVDVAITTVVPMGGVE